jgi:hypothetical protein
MCGLESVYAAGLVAGFVGQVRSCDRMLLVPARLKQPSKPAYYVL